MQHEEGNRQRPQGELLLRTVAMPRDTNPNQDIFGGWIMSQMDLGGGILAAEIARGRIVTVAVQEMNFIPRSRSATSSAATGIASAWAILPSSLKSKSG